MNGSSLHPVLLAANALSARGPAPEVCHDATSVTVSSASSVETFTTGTFHVVLNAHGGTAVDMSGAVNTTVIGSAMHGGDSQQWEFTKFGLGYSIRCAGASAEGHALYLAVDGGEPRDCAPVVAGTHPVAWNVEQVEAGIRCAVLGLGFLRATHSITTVLRRIS